MHKDSFLTEPELLELNLKSYGMNVRISRYARLYGAENISIGDNVRIDDFCILSGKILIGNNIHIAAGCFLFAGEVGLEICDFITLSSRVCVYSISDDYTGNGLVGPIIPEKFRRVTAQKVIIEKHVIVGSGSVVLPGVVLSEGSAIGALSLVIKSTKGWAIYAGIPAKILKARSKNLIKLESEFLQESK